VPNLKTRDLSRKQLKSLISDEKKLADLEAELKDDLRQHVLELVQSIEAGQEVVETDLGELSEASIGCDGLH
jgi:chromosome segregation and condensation protein ScpB